MGSDPFAPPDDPRHPSYEGDPDWWKDDPSLTVVDSGSDTDEGERFYSPDDVPANAADVVAWIKKEDSEARALAALEVERRRDKMRATVTDAIDAAGGLIGAG